MGVVWLVIAVLCVAAGIVLLVVDRRRRAKPPAPEPRVPEPRSPEPDADLFTPEALPRLPEKG